MRRQDREITDRELVEDVLRRGNVLYLAMCDGDTPYVLPLSYGYDGEALWIHSAVAGRKVDVLRRAPRVCFAISPDQELTRGEASCGWSFRYRSVIGEGLVEFLATPAEQVAKTLMLRVWITSLTGKQSGY